MTGLQSGNIPTNPPRALVYTLVYLQLKHLMKHRQALSLIRQLGRLKDIHSRPRSCGPHEIESKSNIGYKAPRVSVVSSEVNSSEKRVSWIFR